MDMLSPLILCSAFVPLLDDIPLPANKVSSSMLIASHLPMSFPNGSGAIGGVKHSVNGEVEKGILTLISSDGPGLQVDLFLSQYLISALI